MLPIKKSLLYSALMVLFFLVTDPLYAQKPVLQQSKDNQLSYVLNNMRASFVSKTKEFDVRLYQVANESGSAEQENCEVTDNFYIAISEFGEQPKQMLFVIKNVYAPKNITLTPQPDQKIKLSFVYTDKDQPKNYTALISSTGVKE